MSTPKKDTKASIKVSDLKPTKSAKGGAKMSTHTLSSVKTHGTH